MSFGPEFEQLDLEFRRLYANVNIDREALRRSRDLIDVCEHMLEQDTQPIKEKTSDYYRKKTIIGRAKHWWEERAKQFSMVLVPQRQVDLTQDRSRYEFTDSDLELLSKVSRGIEDEEGGA